MQTNKYGIRGLKGAPRVEAHCLGWSEIEGTQVQMV